MPGIFASWEAEIRRTVVQSSLGKQFSRPHLQITRVKWTGSMVHVAEYLLGKLVQTPEPPKQKNMSIILGITQTCKWCWNEGNLGDCSL
jgi:hypothetical protein